VSGGATGVGGEGGAPPDERARMLQMARSAIRAHRSPGSHPHEAAHALLQQGDTEGAIALLRRAIEAGPALPFARFTLGETLASVGRFAEALDAYRAETRASPGFAPAQRGAGEALLGLGRWEEAGLAFEEALRNDPALAAAARGLARARAGAARALQAEARRWFRRALEIDPSDATLCAEALAAGPPDAELAMACGDALVARGRAERALACYRIAAEALPDDPALLIRLARALSRTGDAAEAALCCRRALEARPGSAEALRLAAELDEAALRLEEACLARRRAAESPEATPHDWKRLGDLLARTGRAVEAGAALARAVTLGYRSDA